VIIFIEISLCLLVGQYIRYFGDCLKYFRFGGA
jgi:hypothetical protein